MKNIIRTILRRNFIEHSGRFFITPTLLEVLNLEMASPIPKVVIQDSEFIDVSSIGREDRERLGIMSRQIEQLLEVDTNYSEEARRTFARLDIDQALAQQASCEIEFVDFFCDPLEVKRKALTLAILKNVVPKRNDKEYLREVFRILHELQPDIELPLNGYKSFYLKLNWYRKIGFVKGCIDGDPDTDSIGKS